MDLDTLPVGTDLKKKYAFPHLIQARKDNGARRYVVENTRQVSVTFFLCDRIDRTRKPTEWTLRDDGACVFDLELARGWLEHACETPSRTCRRQKTSLYEQSSVGAQPMIGGKVTWKFKFSFTSRDCKQNSGVFRLVCRYKSDPHLTDHIWASSIPLRSFRGSTSPRNKRLLLRAQSRACRDDGDH